MKNRLLHKTNTYLSVFSTILCNPAVDKNMTSETQTRYENVDIEVQKESKKKKIKIV